MSITHYTTPTLPGQGNPPTNPHLPPLPTHATPQASPPEPHIKVGTLNCRGIQANWPAIHMAILRHNPDILILTETKLLAPSYRNFKKVLQQDIPHYLTHHSSYPTSLPSPRNSTTAGHGAGGVIILVHIKYQHQITKHDIPPHLAGHLAHLSLTSDSHQPVHIMGAYMPPASSTIRTSIYAHLNLITTTQNHLGNTVLAGGDWNTTLLLSDRSTMQLTTATHQQACQHAGLYPTNPGPHRPHTYYQHTQAGLQHSSRIDDILINTKPSDTILESVHQAGGTMDHLLLLQDIPHSLLPLWPTQEEPLLSPHPTIPTPLPKGVTQATTRQIHAQLTATFLTNTAPISSYRDSLHTCLQNDYTPAKVLQAGQTLLAQGLDLDTLAEMVIQHLHKAQDLLLQHCPPTPITPHRKLPRKPARQVQHTNKLLQILKTHRQNMHTDPQTPLPPSHTTYPPYRDPSLTSLRTLPAPPPWIKSHRLSKLLTPS